MLPAGTLAAMNVEQFKALQENILVEGRWDSVDEVRINGGKDFVGIYVGGMFIGIEKDGYTHS